MIVRAVLSIVSGLFTLAVLAALALYCLKSTGNTDVLPQEARQLVDDFPASIPNAAALLKDKWTGVKDVLVADQTSTLAPRGFLATLRSRLPMIVLAVAAVLVAGLVIAGLVYYFAFYSAVVPVEVTDPERAADLVKLDDQERDGATPTSPAEEVGVQSGLSTGAIVGIVVGCVVFVGLVAVSGSAGYQVYNARNSDMEEGDQSSLNLGSGNFGPTQNPTGEVYGSGTTPDDETTSNFETSDDSIPEGFEDLNKFL